jgi:hypothetical protein
MNYHFKKTENVMGQYLAIGLITKASVNKQEMTKGKVSEAELTDELKKSLHFNPNIFERSENNDYLVFTLRKDVLETQLIPLLEKLYPLIYASSQDRDYCEIIEKLKETEPAERLDLAESKYYIEFQKDKYGESDRLHFMKDFRPKIKVSYDCIMLSTEGKIMMEEYGRQFNFFKYCIAQTFKEFSLAGAIRVYITG